MKSNQILYVVFVAIILFYLFKNPCRETSQEGFTTIKNMEICPVELLGRTRDCTADMKFNKQFGDKYYTDLDHRNDKR